MAHLKWKAPPVGKHSLTRISPVIVVYWGASPSTAASRSRVCLCPACGPTALRLGTQNLECVFFFESSAQLDHHSFFLICIRGAFQSLTKLAKGLKVRMKINLHKNCYRLQYLDFKIYHSTDLYPCPESQCCSDRVLRGNQYLTQEAAGSAFPLSIFHIFYGHVSTVSLYLVNFDVFFHVQFHFPHFNFPPCFPFYLHRAIKCVIKLSFSNARIRPIKIYSLP